LQFVNSNSHCLIAEAEECDVYGDVDDDNEDNDDDDVVKHRADFDWNCWCMMTLEISP